MPVKVPPAERLQALVRWGVGAAVFVFFAYYFAIADSVAELARPAFSVPGGEGAPFVAAAGILASFLLASGIRVRAAAWSCLILKITAIALCPPLESVEHPFLALMLVIYALFARQEAPGAALARQGLEHPEVWRFAALVSVSLGYSVSGLSKMLYSPWWNGEILEIICPASPLGRAWPGSCAYLPDQLLGLAVLAAEALAFPLVLFSRTRFAGWASTLILHLGALLLMNVPRVSIGVVLMQLFLFDPAWLAGLRARFQLRSAVLE